jgi:hypothetical protein
MINNAFHTLSGYCKQNGYKGWDLFDGLNSKLFYNSPFYRFNLIRLAWIQFFKRSPINLRRFVYVPKGYNPKGLALFASGLLKMGELKKSQALFERLKAMKCEGYDGFCWGYNFDWESRAYYVPQGKPNIVTTVFAANSFLDFYDMTGDQEALNIAINACRFILKHLILYEDNETLCFGYIPGKDARVHNANMLGAALMGRTFSHTHEDTLLEKSSKAMRYAIKALKSDFSWPYGERHHHQFVDNFHTGFNLVALNSWMGNTNHHYWIEELVHAYRYFLDTFWLPSGCPKYYNNSLYPIDIHCSAQGIITCLALQQYDKRSLPLSEKIARWAIENMQDRRGFFYYQKTKWYMNKIPYIRWSQAWMFYALSSMISNDMRDKNANLV